MSLVQRDYILRLVEQMGQAVVVVLGLKKSGQPAEAIHVISQSLQGLVGFDLDDIERLSARDLAGMVRLARSGHSAAAEMVAGQLTVAAGLLTEAAAVHDLQNDSDRSDACRMKALELYLIVLTEEDPNLEHAASAVPPLLDSLQDYALPTAVVEQLWQFHEHSGEFGQAEDRLFELVERDAADPDLIERGIDFYTRLGARSDAELADGGLPRGEVEAGLAELQTLKRFQ